MAKARFILTHGLLIFKITLYENVCNRLIDMGKKILVSMMMVIGLLMSCQTKSPQTIAKRVEVKEFSQMMAKYDKIQVVDVRTPEECQEGMIGAAVNINFYKPDFSTAIQGLDKDTPTFVYCQAGGRSQQALNQMVELGFKEVYELKGGYTAWSYSIGK